MSVYMQHVGVMGMHWGRRMAKDGSIRKKITSVPSQDHKVTSTIRKKKLHEMSNDELQVITKRLQLEKSVKDLSKSDINAGKKFVATVLAGAATTVAMAYVAMALRGGVDLIISTVLNMKTAG
jgi:hypothetical protein